MLVCNLSGIRHFLLRERRVETVSWSIPLVNYTKMSQMHMDIPKGQLLIKKGDLLHIRGNEDVSFEYNAEDVAPILSSVMYYLLEAIENPEETFHVFTTSVWLFWGIDVKKGDIVYVRIPMKDRAEGCCSTACVRYIGRLTADQPGTIFGVEITVSWYLI